VYTLLHTHRQKITKTWAVPGKNDNDKTTKIII
jgi:hypothetical protein